MMELHPLFMMFSVVAFVEAKQRHQAQKRQPWITCLNDRKPSKQLRGGASRRGTSGTIPLLHDDNNSVFLDTTNNIEKQLDHHHHPVRLDMSGRVNCLLLSTHDDEDELYKSDIRPLIQTTTRKNNTVRETKATRLPQENERVLNCLNSFPMIPSIVTLGLDYDFSQCWYGVTRLVADLRWCFAGRQQGQLEKVSSVETSNDPALSSWMEKKDEQQLFGNSGVIQSAIQQPRPQRFWPFPGFPCQIQFTAEKGMVRSKDKSAAQIALAWSGSTTTTTTTTRQENVLARQKQELHPFSVKVRLDSTKTMAFSADIPFFRRRVMWHGRLLFPSNPRQFSLPPPSFVSSASDDELQTNDNNNSWLVPDISVNALGDLSSRNEIWFPWKRRQSPGLITRDGRLGIRFTLRKSGAFDFLRGFSSLLWNPILSQDDDSYYMETSSSYSWLGLEWHIITPYSQTQTRLDAALENLVGTAQASIFQDWIVL